jgi:hypothetical protein
MTGLNVGNAPLGVGEQAAQQTHHRWDTMDQVIAEAIKEGFQMMEMPKFAPPEADPNILANATPDQYALAYTQTEYWQSYDQGCLAWIDGLLMQCDNEMDVIMVDTKRAIRERCKAAKEKKPSEAIIIDEVKANSRWRELLFMHQQLSQKRGIVEAHYKRMARTLKILSRFVEFRKMEIGGNAAGRRYS